MRMFIVLEGTEGCGKSTIAKFLCDKLRNLDLDVVLTREPGGTSIGQEMRKVLLDGNHHPCSRCEALLFFTDRAQHVAEVIKPTLEAGQIVISDRYCYSTFAYQWSARGLDLSTLQTINHFATDGLEPDLVILLDLPVEVGLKRKSGQHLDRIDQENPDFHEEVRNGFLALSQNSDKWCVIDANRSLEEVQSDVWQIVSNKIQRKGA